MCQPHGLLLQSCGRCFGVDRFEHKGVCLQGISLSKLAFASVGKVEGIVAAVNKSLQGKYVQAVQSMQLYVQSPKAREGLLKPIASNIIEAHEQVRKLLHEHYTAEDAQQVSMKSKSELEAVLLGSYASTE